MKQHAIPDIDVRSTTTIKAAPGKLFLLALTGAAMVAVSAMAAFGAFRDSPRFGFISVPAGWVGLLFFGLILAILLKRLVNGAAPTIILTPTGIRDLRVSRKEIPWNAVESIASWKMSGQDIMIIKVPEETEAELDLTFLARSTRKMNAKLKADGLAITAQGTKVNPDQLMEITLAYLKHYREEQG